jgi:hypothetical protein
MVGSMKVWAATAVAATALAVGGQSAKAELVYGITFDNNLFSFDSATPNDILTGVYVSGLQSNEFIQAIDFRPATGQLYAIGSTNRVYTLNTATAVATLVGGPFTPPLNGTAYGSDFNPTVDRIRIHSNADQNLRLFPTTGLVAATDPNLYYAAGDSGAGLDPNIVATAYTNNFAGATTTQLYSIDSVRDTLNLHSLGAGDPAGSFAQMTTVGTLRNAAGATIPFQDYSGMDISPSGTAYVHWNNAAGLFGTVDLATGIVTTTGNMGGGAFVRDIAVVIPEPASMGLMGLAVAGLVARRRK